MVTCASVRLDLLGLTVKQVGIVTWDVGVGMGMGVEIGGSG